METPRFTGMELLSGGWINKYLLHYEMADKTPVTYEAVSRKGLEEYRAQLERNAQGEAPTPDAVCVLPVLPDGSLLLIREFRYALNSWCIAFPAGLIDPGEDLIATVDRELREETGYALCTDVPDPAVPLPQSAYSSVGLGEENVQVVIARVEKVGEPRTEHTELIEVFTLRCEDVREFLASNRTPIGTRAQLLLEAATGDSVLRTCYAASGLPGHGCPL